MMTFLISMMISPITRTSVLIIQLQPISFSEDGEVGISDVGNDDDAVVHDEEHTVDDAEIDDDEANNNDDKNDDEESDHQDKIRLSDTYDWIKSDLSYENSNFDSHFILPFTL